MSLWMRIKSIFVCVFDLWFGYWADRNGSFSRWSGSTRSSTVSSPKILSFICRLENLKAAHECLINAHHCTRVVKLATIIRCTEECNKLAALEEFVAVFNDLMRAADQIDVVLLVKLSHHLLTKCKGNTAIVVAVCLDASFGIRPQ